MNNRALAIILGIFILIVIGAAVGAYLYTHERVEVTEKVPPSGEARQNPYLALERLYNGMGYDALSERRLSDPENDDALVLWMSPERNMDPRDIPTWTWWVREGGHIVLVQPEESHDPFLEALGFVYVLDESHDPLIEALKFVYDPDATSSTHLSWSAPDVDWEKEDSKGSTLALSRPFDAGRVTLLASEQNFLNQHIGKEDNAPLALEIAALASIEDYDWIMIVLFGQRVSWISHVLFTFWPLFIILAAILLLALIVGFRRYGPVEVPMDRVRRSRVEHIEAMGRFLWTRDASETLLDATREALVSRLASRRPSIRTLNGPERHALVAEELEITPSEARRLLEAPAPTNPNTFLQTIDTLETYRRSL